MRSAALSLTRTPNHDRDRTKHEAMPGDLAPARPNRTPILDTQTRSREALDRGPRGRLGPPRTRLRKECRRVRPDSEVSMPLPGEEPDRRQRGEEISRSSKVGSREGASEMFASDLTKSNQACTRRPASSAWSA